MFDPAWFDRFIPRHWVFACALFCQSRLVRNIYLVIVYGKHVYHTVGWILATLGTNHGQHTVKIGSIPAAVSSMERAVIKFSSENCGTCHRMAFYDSKVAEELGLRFINVKMQDTATYRQYRQILLAQYPDKTDMGWPTYIICDAPDAEFQIIGEVKGGHPRGEFKTRLQTVLESSSCA